MIKFVVEIDPLFQIERGNKKYCFYYLRKATYTLYEMECTQNLTI